MYFVFEKTTFELRTESDTRMLEASPRLIWGLLGAKTTVELRTESDTRIVAFRTESDTRMLD